MPEHVHWLMAHDSGGVSRSKASLVRRHDPVPRAEYDLEISIAKRKLNELGVSCSPETYRLSFTVISTPSWLHHVAIGQSL